MIVFNIWAADKPSVALSNSNGSINEVNHSTSKGMLKADLTVNVERNYFRSSYTSKTYVEVQNNGSATAVLPVLSLFYPEGMYLTSANGLFSESEGTYSIKIDSIKPGEHVFVELIDSVGPKLKAGEELSLTATISDREGELYTFDDEISFKQEFVGPINSNGISVAPAAYVTQPEELIYTIRFQNNGSHSSSRVVVLDQLSESLDWSTITTVFMSHKGQFSIDEKGLCTWSFPNINLPDVSKDEERSQGIIMFSIKPKVCISGNGIVFNEASIVFDDATPMLTNQVKNRIIEKEEEVFELNVYPNPVRVGSTFWISSKKNVNMQTPNLKWIEIRDASTALIGTKKVKGSKVDVIIENRKPGIYTIVGIDENGNLHTGKIVLK